MGDVIAKWQMVKPLQGDYVMADVIASGRWKTTRSITSILVSECVKQNLIPKMCHMVFTHISIEGWIIDPYVQSLFYSSHLVQVLPPNNVKVVDGNIVTSDAPDDSQRQRPNPEAKWSHLQTSM